MPRQQKVQDRGRGCERPGARGRGLALTVLGAVLVACAAPFPADGRPRRKARTGTTMKLELRLPQSRFLPGESIGVDLRLTNPGAQPVEVPVLQNIANDQPVYTLTRPDGHAPETFTLRSVTWEGPGPLPPGGTPVVQSLRPGATFEAGIPLEAWKPHLKPGRYTLQARIDWNGWTAASNPVEFTVAESVAYVAAGSGGQLGGDAPSTVRLAWVAKVGEGRVLGQTLVDEARPDLGETKGSGGQTLRDVGPQASEPFIPWANFDPASGRWGWHGWREGATLKALPLGADTPRSFDLGSPAARLVRPALMAAPSGDLDVFALSEDGRELRRVHFAFPHDPGPAPAPTLRWKLPLPAPTVAARSTLGTEAQGSPLKVGLVAQEEAALALRLVDAGDAPPTKLRSVHVPRGHALRASEPALALDAKGVTRLAVVFSTDEARQALALAEAVFPADSAEAPSVQVTPLTTLAQGDKVAQAAVTYPAQAQALEAGQRRWLVLLENGEALSGTQPGKRFHLPAPPTLPLELVMSFSTPHVVLLDPARGPRLSGIP